MHTIRLRRPWCRQRGDQSSRVDVPDETPLSGGSSTQTVYRRNFNRPTGLTSETKIRLRVESICGSLASVQINELPLTSNTSAPYEIELHELNAHNEIEITINDSDGTAGHIDGEVYLVIQDHEPSA